MSSNWHRLIWNQGPDDPLDTLLLLAVASLLRDGETCRPRVDYLANRSRCAVKVARKRLRAMQQDGYLTIRGRGGRGLSNVYALNRDRFLRNPPRNGQGIRQETVPAPGKVSAEKPSPQRTESLPSKGQNPPRRGVGSSYLVRNSYGGAAGNGRRPAVGPLCHQCGRPAEGHDKHAENIGDPHPFQDAPIRS